jgi:hypothetical protein
MFDALLSFLINFTVYGIGIAVMVAIAIRAYHQIIGKNEVKK